MRDLLLTLIVFGSVPLILVRPHVGILMFAWISYMNPHRFTWGFAYDMPFAAIIGGATLLAMLFSREGKRLPMRPIMAVWFGWILWMNVSTLFALEPVDAAWEWDRSMKIQLMAWVTIMLLQSRERITALVWCLVVSIGFFAVKGGVFAITTSGAYQVWGPPGTFFHGTNPLALAMLMTLPLMLYLVLHTRNRLIRLAVLGCALLSALAIVSTYSRGAFVAGIAVALYLLAKSPRKLLFTPILVVVVGSVALFMPQKYYDRIASISHYEEDSSAVGRLEAWKVAYGVAKDRPLVGGGFQMMSPDLFARHNPDAKPRDVHSIYFEVLGEQGFVGLTLYLCLMWLAMREGKRIRRLTKGRKELRWAFDLASSAQVGIFAYAVGGTFLGLAYFDLYYHLIAILVLIGMEVEKTLAQDSRVEAQSRAHESVAADLAPAPCGAAAQATKLVG